MNNVSNKFNVTFGPPKAVWLDYVQIGYLSLMVLVGLPLNLYSLIRTVKNNCTMTAVSSSSSSSMAKSNKPMTLLKLHLAVTDLMILIFFTFPKIVWWSTYAWLAGDLMCKLIHFLSSFAFCCSSNVVASISIYRWQVARKLTCTQDIFYKKLYGFLTVSYALAFLCSLPQFFVWCIIYPFMTWPTWAQCVTKWKAAQWTATNRSSFTNEEKIYSLYYLLVVFWIPFFVVIVCYLLVFYQLKHSIREMDGTIDTMPLRSLSESERVINPSKFYRLSCKSSTDNSISLNNGNRKTSTIEEPAMENAPLQGLRKRSLSVCTLTKAKHNMIIKTAYILLAYLFCWSSYNILAVLQEMRLVADSSYWRLLYNLIVFNAVLNPFLYGI